MSELKGKLISDPDFLHTVDYNMERIKNYNGITEFELRLSRFQAGILTVDPRSYLPFLKNLQASLDETELFAPSYVEHMETIVAGARCSVPIYADTVKRPVHVGTMNLDAVESYKGKGAAWLFRNMHIDALNEFNISSALSHAGYGMRISPIRGNPIVLDIYSKLYPNLSATEMVEEMKKGK